MVSVGRIVGGAFGIFTERLRSVLIWAAVYFGASLVGGVLFALVLTGSFGLSASPDPAAFTGGVILFSILFYLAYLLLNAVITNAVFRSVLMPDDPAFAGLRLGTDEFRTLGLTILYAIGIFVLTLVGYLLTILVTVVLGAALGAGMATVAIGAVLVLALFAFLIWVQVRLVPLFALSLYRHSISIDGAWALTRGRFWTLFASYLVALIPLAVIGAILVALLMGGYFAALAGAGGDPALIEAAQRSFAEQQAARGFPVQLLTMLVWALFSAFASTLWMGLAASATRALLDDRGDLSEEEVYRSAEVFE